MDLRTLEGLCEALFTTQNNRERQEAHQKLLSLERSVENIPHCTHVIGESKNPYALVVASRSLLKLVTKHWNTIAPEEGLYIRSYVLEFLANVGHTLEDWVANYLIQLVCRITKLGWFEDKKHRELSADVRGILSHSTSHCVLGMKILKALTTEINTISHGTTLGIHRKTSVSFREECLMQIFQSALTTLKGVHGNRANLDEQQKKLGVQCTQLCVQCLSFDFIGTNPDESGDEAGAIHVPLTWKTIIQEPTTMSLFFDIYASWDAPATHHALEFLCLLANVRRSLFTAEFDRSQFLAPLLAGVCQILQHQMGMHSPENYHQLCRLLGRLKGNYQLSELVKSEGYTRWIELAAKFSVDSIMQWQWSSNSVHYILQLWGSLVTALPYVKADQNGNSNTLLEKYIPQIVQAYVQSRLASVDVIVHDQTIDNPLDDEGLLMDQMERLPKICRYKYEEVGRYLQSQMDPLLQAYQEAHQSSNASSLLAIECKLSWLIYIIGSIVGSHSSMTSYLPVQEGCEMVDSTLCMRIFMLLQGVTQILVDSAGQKRGSIQLEQALLFFCQCFRRAYINDSVGLITSVSARVGLVSGGSTALAPVGTNASNKQQMYHRMFERMNLGDPLTVVNMIISKIVGNLKYWNGEELIIGKTLALFVEISNSSYSSGKMLLGLAATRHIIDNHTEEHFPFMRVPEYSRYRTTLHTVLTKLLYSNVDDIGARTKKFLEPSTQVLSQLRQFSEPSGHSHFRHESVKRAVIGVCRDLRGVVQATVSKKTYSMLFDIVYPDFFPVFVQTARVWFDDPEVMIPLLKFLAEFVRNHGQRILFDTSSPNGILLFWQVSKIIVAYGRGVLQLNIAEDAPDLYKTKLKGFSICLRILSHTLDGNYVNFGVFALYNDPHLDDVLDVALQLVLSIPGEQLLQYPKVCKDYFTFLRDLFKSHIPSVLGRDVAFFRKLVLSLFDGLSSADVTPDTAKAIDHFATYSFDSMEKDKPAVHTLKAFLQAHPTLLQDFITSIFSSLLFGDSSYHWALSRPILSLILADSKSGGKAWPTYKQQLLSTQSPDNHAKLCTAFTTLQDDIQENLESSNRDKFSHRLSKFLHTVHTFLTVPT